MNTAALIVARLSSTRLKQKNILEVNGKPMIINLIDRVKKSSLVDEVIITTSDESSDDPLEELAENNNLKIYRGSLNNVMERIVGAADQFDIENIVEILGDNPFVHSDLIDDVIHLFFNKKADYSANITKEYPEELRSKQMFSIGIRVQVYKKSLAEEYTKYPEYIGSDVHPCAYIFENPNSYKLEFLGAEEKWQFANLPELNLAVNYPKNFEFVKEIYRLKEKNKDLDLEMLFKLINQKPQFIELLGPEI